MSLPDTTPAIIGAGMTPFGRFQDTSLKALAKPAIEDAVRDAGLQREDIDMAFVANAVSAIVTGQVAVVGQVVLAHAGYHGIPVFNIDNACAGSATALNLATMAIRSGAAKNVLVLGVEKLYSEDKTKTFRGLNGAADIDWVKETGVNFEGESVFVKYVYPARLHHYAKKYGLDPMTLALIAVKNRRHAASNERAQYRKPMTVEEVLAARIVTAPLTTLMCAPVGDGAAAVVVTDSSRARRSKRQPIWIRGSKVSMGSPVGPHEGTIRRLGDAAYEEAGTKPADVNVAELHDATAFSELLAYEELRLSERGEGARLVERGDTSLGGRIPVNVSGGLESRGHPIAASGLGQVFEIVTQLRGEAGERQVKGARIGLTEMAGGYVNGDSASVAVHILGVDPAG